MSETKHTPYERKGRFIDNTDGANVAECRNANIAAFIVRACNAHDDLLATLDKIADWLQVAESLDTQPNRKTVQRCLKHARAEIAKAKP